MKENKYPEHVKPGYEGPYLERAGENARVLVETLVRPPEFPLSNEEHGEALAFEKAIFDHEVREDVTVEQVIRQHKSEASSAPIFFAQAFMENGIEIEGKAIPSFASHDEVYDWAARAIRDEIFNPKELLSIANQSSSKYKATVAEALIKNEELPVEWMDHEMMVLRPGDFLQSAHDVAQARRYLLEQRKLYKEDGVHNIDGAKRAVTDVYLAAIDTLLVSDVPVAEYLVKQSQRLGDEQMEGFAREVIPVGFRHALLDNAAQRDSVIRRLDYVQNGISVQDEDGVSAVSRYIETIAEENAATNEHPYFTPEQTQILKNTMVEPEQIVTIMTNIIRKANLLSRVPPPEVWVDRSERAEDGLFQVVINPKGSQFNVEGRDGSYKVASTPRSLYDVMVVGGIHELRHIDQAQADLALGKALNIANVKGKRVSMLREGGANMKEREAQMKLFGESKPFALTYARALRSLEDGGTIYDASRAFYNEKRIAVPDISPVKAAQEAADRVTRLIRRGGRNSQSMAYAEEGIIAKDLKNAAPEVQARAMKVVSLDLVDQARLHRYGLLPDISEGEHIDWDKLVLEELELYIDAALHNPADKVK